MKQSKSKNLDQNSIHLNLTEAVSPHRLYFKLGSLVYSNSKIFCSLSVVYLQYVESKVVYSDSILSCFRVKINSLSLTDFMIIIYLQV